MFQKGNRGGTYCELVKYDRWVGQSQTGWRVCSRVAVGEQAGGKVDMEEEPNKAKEARTSNRVSGGMWLKGGDKVSAHKNSLL